ncbi:MAG: ferrous iron transport protein A [Rubrivivax sp.]|nr:MAG: ferrous iron transport protein A [Rubrivivax sp.]
MTAFQAPLPASALDERERDAAAGIATGALVLSDAPLNQACELIDVQVPAGQPEWAHRLAEIGFLPGEPLRLIARGLPGGDPLAVRIGSSTFALRRAEAACVRVRLLA